MYTKAGRFTSLLGITEIAGNEKLLPSISNLNSRCLSTALPQAKFSRTVPSSTYICSGLAGISPYCLSVRSLRILSCFFSKSSRVFTPLRISGVFLSSKSFFTLFTVVLLTFCCTLIISRFCFFVNRFDKVLRMC